MTTAASPTPWSCFARRRPRRTPPGASPRAHRHLDRGTLPKITGTLQRGARAPARPGQAFADAGAPDGDVFEGIAELLLALGRAKEAQPYVARAAETLGKDAGLVSSRAVCLKRLQDHGRG